jgi:hypothetical protein
MLMRFDPLHDMDRLAQLLAPPAAMARPTTAMPMDAYRDSDATGAGSESAAGSGTGTAASGSGSAESSAEAPAQPAMSGVDPSGSSGR